MTCPSPDCPADGCPCTTAELACAECESPDVVPGTSHCSLCASMLSLSNGEPLACGVENPGECEACT